MNWQLVLNQSRFDALAYANILFYFEFCVNVPDFCSNSQRMVPFLDELIIKLEAIWIKLFDHFNWKWEKKNYFRNKNYTRLARRMYPVCTQVPKIYES